MVDLEEYAITGRLGPVGGGADRSAVIADLGEAEFTERQKAGRVALLYGDVELWFYQDRLDRTSVRLREGEPANGGPIELSGFWPDARRSMNYVRDLFLARDISWRLDEIMSGINPQETSQTWISERDVHLAFFEGELQAFGAVHRDAR